MSARETKGKATPRDNAKIRTDSQNRSELRDSAEEASLMGLLSSVSEASSRLWRLKEVELSNARNTRQAINALGGAFVPENPADFESSTPSLKGNTVLEQLESGVSSMLREIERISQFSAQSQEAVKSLTATSKNSMAEAARRADEARAMLEASEVKSSI